MDPLIFADPDPGSQNLADPTDPDPEPDPKHWIKYSLKEDILETSYLCLHIKVLLCLGGM